MVSFFLPMVLPAGLGAGAPNMRGLAYLKAILQLRDDGIFGDELEELLAPGEGQWDDEEKEDEHLREEEHKHLSRVSETFI